MNRRQMLNRILSSVVEAETQSVLYSWTEKTRANWFSRT